MNLSYLNLGKNSFELLNLDAYSIHAMSYFSNDRRAIRMSPYRNLTLLAVWPIAMNSSRQLIHLEVKFASAMEGQSSTRRNGVRVGLRAGKSVQ